MKSWSCFRFATIEALVLVVLAETLLVFEVFVDFSWEEGQFAHGKIEGRVASRVEEGSVVGDDQAGFLEGAEKVF